MPDTPTEADRITKRVIEKITRQEEEIKQLRRAVEAVLDCETDTDEEGNQYIKVPARSIFDLGAQLRAILDDDYSDCSGFKEMESVHH